MNLPILNFKRLIMTEWELVSCSPLLIFRESVSAGWRKRPTTAEWGEDKERKEGETADSPTWSCFYPPQLLVGRASATTLTASQKHHRVVQARPYGNRICALVLASIRSSFNRPSHVWGAKLGAGESYNTHIPKWGCGQSRRAGIKARWEADRKQGGRDCWAGVMSQVSPHHHHITNNIITYT